MQSEIVGEEDAEAFRKLVPSAEYVDIPEAAHMVAGDRNDAFSDAVISFLERHH
jgi:pimeloyl-ACP methyl ester carboxylesterase